MVAAQPKAEAAVEDKIGDYCKAKGGNRPIRKVLIANNGMAATKSILSMRQWAYMELGDEKLIEFVAMASTEDLNANAEFIRLADSFVEVPAGGNCISKARQAVWKNSRVSAKAAPRRRKIITAARGLASSSSGCRRA